MASGAPQAPQNQYQLLEIVAPAADEHKKTRCCMYLSVIIGIIFFSVAIWVFAVAVKGYDDPAALDSVNLKRDIEPAVIELLSLIPDNSSEPEPPQCAQLRSSISNSVDKSVIKNLVLVIGDQRGTHVNLQKGSLINYNSTLWIASSSKLISSTVMLWLVDRGLMSLGDHPQQYLSWWDADIGNDKNKITLEQLLSFTSGIPEPNTSNDEYDCSRDEDVDLETCGQEIFEKNLTGVPGTVYEYGSSHMTIAANMAQNATGMNFTEIFNEFKQHITNLTGTSISDHTKYTRASVNNPWLAGGMDATVRDYHTFLSALYMRTLISNQSFSQLVADHTADATFIYSPVTQYNEQWHYGLGCWIECPYGTWDSPPCGVYNNPNVSYTISSPGAFGFYPWINLNSNYYGIVGTSSLVELIARLVLGGILLAISFLFCIGSCVCCCCIRKKQPRQIGVAVAETAYAV